MQGIAESHSEGHTTGHGALPSGRGAARIPRAWLLREQGKHGHPFDRRSRATSHHAQHSDRDDRDLPPPVRRHVVARRPRVRRCCDGAEPIMSGRDVPRRIPRLRFRPTTQRDLPECFELLPPWMRPDEALRRAHAELWPRLLENPAACITTVMEDLAMPPGRRIQGWGYGIALAPAWVERHALATRPRAWVIRRIYAELLEGSFELMTDAEVGAVNEAGTLHMINFYTQRQNDLSDGYAQSVLLVANEAFRLATSGFNTEAMYLETSAYDAPGIAAAGFFERPYSDETSLEGLAGRERPVLFGVTREEALASLPGTTARHVFEHQPPMFRFSASQRQLLWLALFDDSDAHLTEQLGVSVHGLKKLWRGIYERIEDRMPEFFGDSSGEDDGRRGPEKRRQVLAYVRQRPEELRAWRR
jgi:hypothetical protein